jgi:D-citramalate synthase
MHSSIEIMDTTLRDGEQTRGVSFTQAEKLNIARMMLASVNVDRLEVCSALVSPVEHKALAEICDWARERSMLERIEVLTFVDGSRSIDWVQKAGGRTINLLTKGSRKHCEMQLRKTLEEHQQDIAATVRVAAERGMNVNVYLEDWSNGMRDSMDYVIELTRFLSKLPVQRIMLPDTLGVFQPRDVRQHVGKMLEEFPELHFDFHPHNDYGLATANALEAVNLGVRGIHCTVNCLGERAGNVDLAQITAVFRDKAGLQLRINEEALSNAAGMVEVFSGKRLAPNAPIVGRDVFTHTAGIHADGDKKAGLYSNELAPDRFGRSRIYALGKMSGKASVAQNLKQLGMELSNENLERVLGKIVSLADEKKSITMEDLPFIIADVLEGKGKSSWAVRVIEVCMTSRIGGEPEAEVTLEFHGEKKTASGSGDGAYDAFMDAVKKIAAEAGFEMPELVDYEVHIPPGGKTSALVETTITWEYRGHRFRSTGLDCDQSVAAVKATERALNIMIDPKFRHLRRPPDEMLP